MIMTIILLVLLVLYLVHDEVKFRQRWEELHELKGDEDDAA
jgi:hypothetical protein